MSLKRPRCLRTQLTSGSWSTSLSPRFPQQGLGTAPFQPSAASSPPAPSHLSTFPTPPHHSMRHLLKTETPVCLWHHRALMCRQGPVPSSPVQCRPSPVMPAGQASQPFPGMQDTFEKHGSSQRFLECSQKRPKVSPSHLQLVT